MEIVPNGRGGTAGVNGAGMPPIPGEGFNFVTEIFFLTLRGLHLGLIPTMDRFFQIERRLSDLQGHYGLNIGDPEFDQAFSSILVSHISYPLPWYPPWYTVTGNNLYGILFIK